VTSIPVSDLLGFRDGTMSVHTSRTMMLHEMELILKRVALDAPVSSYVEAIIEENVLGKPTRSTRQRTAKRLRELYALDPRCTLFRLLRYFWSSDPGNHPMLAFLMAYARDPLLREATPFVLAIPVGQIVSPGDIVTYLNAQYPSRFCPTTVLSTAQNLASSWTQAGYLRGKKRKRRCRPHLTPVVSAFALLLGYLCGLRGALLLDSLWTQALECSIAERTGLAEEASRQGWLRYKATGAVVDITFPGLLTSAEEQAVYEQDRPA
ncbi:MAG: hypothetical protein ACREOH_09045, partial [Candidatus Entotheonellia bacterium]